MCKEVQERDIERRSEYASLLHGLFLRLSIENSHKSIARQPNTAPLRLNDGERP